MRAAVLEQFGGPDVVKIKQVPKPAPQPDQILIRIHASTVDIADVRCRALRVPPGMGLLVRVALGIFRPRKRILGMELAGQVEAVGDQVTKFKPGDKVFGSSGFDFGCHAEYRALSEDAPLAAMPEGISYEEAVALGFGAHTALIFFHCGKLRAGEHILVNGASGAVGVAAVQIAKHHVGAEVTGVCSTRNVELVKSLGADHVIDYTRHDFRQGGARYDVVMDNVGNAAYPQIRYLLKPGGRHFMVIAANLGQMLLGALRKPVVTGEEDGGAKLLNAAMIQQIANLYRQGKLKPVIDKTFPFAEIAKAHAYVDTGHKRGSVVVTMEPETA